MESCSIFLYACLAVFVACLCVYNAEVYLVGKTTKIADRIAQGILEYTHQEGRARERTFFLQGVDNLQMWKLGGKAHGLAYKVPYQALWQEEVDLGKYLTNEELAAFKVGFEVYGKDKRMESIAKSFKF